MSVPRALPGFDWDPVRNRYFPASSKPLPRSPEPLPARITPSARARKPRHFVQSIHGRDSQHIERLRSPNRHHLLTQHYAETTSVKEQRVPIFGAIRNFTSTKTEFGHNYCLIGDDRGWIYSLRCAEDDDDDDVNRHWTPEFNLGTDSQVSSLNVCDSYFVATSFGPNSNARFQNVDNPNLSFIMTAKHGHDIRCADFANTDELILGAKQRAIYITGIFDTPKTQVLQTNSDVFSVARQQNLVYLGTRNGTIHRFDLRISDSKGSQGLFSNKLQSSVLHLQSVNDMHFLSSYMNGQILMHDIRFPFSNTPLFQITGQVNAYAPHLGITTDPYNDFLFAGGQDCRIRAWSLRNGDPITPTLTKPSTMNPLSSLNFTGVSPVSVNPFLKVFKEPVQTMQVTAERMGMCLWVGYGDKLCQYGLGRRGQGEDEETWQLWDESNVRRSSPWTP